MNGHYYIGSTSVSFHVRKNSHLRELRKNTHENRHLQNAFNKYGEEAFTWDIVEIVPPEQCLTREQWYLDNKPCEYNICRTAGSTRGVKASKETRAKISASKIGKKDSPKRIEQKSQHMYERNLIGERNYMFGRSGILNPASKPTVYFNSNTNMIHEFESVTALAKFLDISVQYTKDILKGQKTGNFLKKTGIKIQYKEVI